MERGNNGGFNPYRDSHGRYAAAGSSAARTPHPDARDAYRQGAVRILQPPARADGTYYAELWHGDQFVSETRLTRAHRTEMAALRAEADQLAGTAPTATPAPAKGAPTAQAPARPAPVPTPPPARPTPAPPKAVAWRPEMTREEADVWAKDSAIKDPLFHSVRDRDMNQMVNVLRKGFDANHEGAYGFPRWGTGIYLAYGGAYGSKGLYERWMEHGYTFEARVNVKRPFRIDVGGDDQPNLDRYLSPALRVEYEERIKADYARQRLRAGPHPSRYFRFNSHTPYQVFKEILHEHGYDALIVDGSGIATGGKQLVVFDPTNVTIVGTERFENEPYEPDLL